MLQFEKFVARHGEIAAQAIIENLERFENVRALHTETLEDRWQRLMVQAEEQNLAA